MRTTFVHCITFFIYCSFYILLHLAAIPVQKMIYMYIVYYVYSLNDAQFKNEMTNYLLCLKIYIFQGHDV